MRFFTKQSAQPAQRGAPLPADVKDQADSRPTRLLSAWAARRPREAVGEWWIREDRSGPGVGRALDAAFGITPGGPRR
jgi:hypothetical protein